MQFIYRDSEIENNSSILGYWRIQLQFGCIAILQKCGKILAAGPKWISKRSKAVMYTVELIIYHKRLTIEILLTTLIEG